jgi:V-type H+-transporting ATPase subunit C
MYWLVSLPHGGRPDQVWSQLQESTTYANDYSSNFKFALPESFRVGTLDTLLALSDELAKVNQAVEGTVNKVRRQLVELQAGVAPEERADVWVEGQTPEGYLQRFAWNEAQYPSRRPLKDIVASITDNVQKLDDDLKVGGWWWGGGCLAC